MAAELSTLGSWPRNRGRIWLLLAAAGAARSQECGHLWRPEESRERGVRGPPEGAGPASSLAWPGDSQVRRPAHSHGDRKHALF